MGEYWNWAGNLRYSAAERHVPESVEQVRRLVARSGKVKTIGTRHSFNRIADTTGVHISLEKLDKVLDLDAERRTVTVQGGIRYGELSRWLDERGWAMENFASLPHISVAGACATATHGSGDRSGNLATAVAAMEIVTGEGDLVRISRDDPDFAGAVVHLGGIGVVVALTLDIVPSYQVCQRVYERLPFAALQDRLDDLFASGYSVSLFTDWTSSTINQVWVKRKTDEAGEPGAADLPEALGAAAASERMHPVPGMPAENCTEQLGVPGPSWDRLPHFRMEFTPSAGEELQSEYFVARKDAYAALCALCELQDRIAPLLYTSEVRSIAADPLWMSPAYGRDSIGIHFTWKREEEAVRKLLPAVEERLAPYAARPHWGKLFTMPRELLHERYEKLPAFRGLLETYDPHHKFRNDFLAELL